MQARYWLRPTFSVMLKEIRIVTRYRTWLLSTFIWPVLYPLTFYFIGLGLSGRTGQGLGNFERLANTSDFASFLILGNLVWMFININLWVGGMSLQRERLRGMFDTTWTLPVNKLSLVMGATFASLLLNFLPMVVSIAFYAALGVFKITGNIFNILATIFLIMPFLVGFLTLFAALTIRLRQANLTVQVVRSVLSIVCGLQFPLAILPKKISAISGYIPLTHFVDIIRGIIIHKHPLSYYTGSIVYIIVSGIVMMITGILAFRYFINNVRKRGLVAGY
ncbi:MAG: ABC transporter permease [Spirochaetes bacterium]|nr:ABC transporter permease [Spirochaetota bacterium]